MTMYKLCPFFVLALAAFAFAALERYPPEQKPEQFANQEGCYLSSLGLVVPSDKPYYPKGDQRCEAYVCNKDSGETLRETCGAIGVTPGCQKTVPDYTKDYPDCCATVQCDATTVAPTTTAPTTEAPTTTAAPNTARAEAAAGPGQSSATASANSGPGQPPVTTTEAATTIPSTTVAATTEAPTTIPSTTVAATTEAPTTIPSTTVAATTETPTTTTTTAAPGQSYASAYASSQPGQPPVTRTFATPGAQAQASAT